MVEPLPSRDHTERMLAAAGADVDAASGGRRSPSQPAGAPRAGRDRRPRRLLLGRLLHRRRAARPRQRSRCSTGSASTRPGPACCRSSSGWARRSRRAERRAGGEPIGDPRGPRRRSCAGPRSAAPRCRWRSTSCRWSPSPPASPRGRRRSATRPSCAARSPTGSRPSRAALSALGGEVEATEDGMVVDRHRRPARRHDRLARRPPDRDARRRRRPASREGVEVEGMDAAAVSYPGFEADLGSLRLRGGGRPRRDRGSEMDYEQISYERRGPVAVITIERPERMNAIGARTHRELVDAWGRFRDDDEALVGILTGAGERAFCAGGDLKCSPTASRWGRPAPPRSRPTTAARPTASSVPRAGPTSTSRRSPRSTASPTPAASSGPAGATWRSPTSTPASASPAGAGTSASPTAAPSGCRGSSAGGGRWS